MIIYAICCFYIVHVYNISKSQTELYSEESTGRSPWTMPVKGTSIEFFMEMELLSWNSAHDISW